jgi:hypothetical protein
VVSLRPRVFFKLQTTETTNFRQGVRTRMRNRSFGHWVVNEDLEGVGILFQADAPAGNDGGIDFMGDQIDSSNFRMSSFFWDC